MKNFLKNTYIKIFLSVLLIFIVWSIWYIMSWMNYVPPHYHTNFSVMILGNKYDFSWDEYSEDVASCNLWDEIFPKHRVHLHENNWDTIHVHHWWVTWGHFFANNGITFSNTHMSFDNGDTLIRSDSKNTFTFILNDKKVDNPFNRYMISEDRLLIYYWDPEDKKSIAEAYAWVKTDAWEFNKKYDPGSCSWSNENSKWYLIKQMLHLTH